MTTSVLQTSLNFLEKLRENNHKDWMQDHKKEYLASEVSLKELYKEILKGLEVTDEIEKQKNLLIDYCAKDTLAVYYFIKFIFEKIMARKPGLYANIHRKKN